MWRLGFRPFYLGAAAFAALAVPIWLALLEGVAHLPSGVAPLLWHAHEMLFGFAAAVIVGFVLTAGRAWTGLDTPRGPMLGGLFLLWLAARLAGAVAPPALYAVLDLALLPLVALALARVLWKARNRRNLPLVGLLALLALANAAFHAAALGVVAWDPLRALHAGLALVVGVECMIGGRIIPAFTGGAVPGLKLSVPARLPQVAMASAAAALAAWVFAPPLAAWVGGLLALAAGLQAALLWHWAPGAARGRPLLWVLHAGYAWIPVGLAGLALSQAGWLAPSAGVHALAVGATGGLVIGMVTRTARGHTGRPLKASRPEVTAYGLVLAAACLRVAGPLVGPAEWAWWAAGAAWSAAFLIYLVVFTPWLLRPRLDGKDG